MDDGTLLILLFALLVILCLVWLLLPHQGTYAELRSGGSSMLTVLYRNGRVKDNEPVCNDHEVEECAEDERERRARDACGDHHGQLKPPAVYPPGYGARGWRLSPHTIAQASAIAHGRSPALLDPHLAAMRSCV